MPTWSYDEDCLIAACAADEKLIAAAGGWDPLVELIVVELRKIRVAPHAATYMILVDGEPAYLHLIGSAWIDGRVRPPFLLLYTLHKWVIEPVQIFQASEVSTADDVLSRAAAVSRRQADAPSPESLENRVTREVRSARKQRKN